MNVVFYLLIALSLVVLWFLLASLFKPIGKIFHKVNEEVRDAMELNDNDNEEEKN